MSAITQPPHRRHHVVETQTRDVHSTPDVVTPGRVTFATETFRSYQEATEIAPGWRADTIILPAGETRMVAGAARQRKTLHVWADPANPAPVWLSPASINSDPAGANRSGAVPIAAPLPLDLTHTGPVYAWAAVAGCKLYLTAEFLAYDPGPHARDE